MATRQDFLDKQAKFNANWGLNISIETLETGIRKLARVKNFTFEQRNVAASTYAKLFTNVFATYFNKNSRITENSLYNQMRNFSADAFINEFEDLMVTKFEAEKTDNRQRRPFEGLNRNTLKNFVNSYNKNLSDTWVDKIKKGTMTIEEMQAITNNAYDLLMVKDKTPTICPQIRNPLL